MEWREQSSVSCDQAYLEAQRWIEAVTKKTFGSNDFRSALENGVLLCDLINQIKPGVIRKVNRLPTPIAGLDNLNVFLKACLKLGLKEAQLFHPGDLQDLSSRVTVKHQETNRRLKNVLITIYWLGRRAHSERLYDGPYLNFKAFEGLLGTALYKAIQDISSQKGSSVRDSGFGDNWYSEREELDQLREGGGGHRRDDSLDSLDSLGSRPHSVSSDATLKGSSEGCCSDTEADSVFRMAENKDSLSYRRSVVITPKVSTQFNQFLPTKDKPSGYVPAPLRKKRAERSEDNRRSWANPVYDEDEGPLTRSKSVSDINVEPTATCQLRMEEVQKYRQQLKQSEDQWQDDLSKWKTRRRSVNSDIVKKKEEREKIEQITYGSRRSQTFQELQEESDSKQKSSIGSRLGSLYFNEDEDVFVRPVTSPRTRFPPSRSYTVDTPYRSSDFLEPTTEEDKPPAASVATGRGSLPPTSTEADIVDSPADSNTSASITPISRSSPLRPQSPTPLPRSSVSHTSTTKTVTTATTVSSLSSTQKVPESRRPLSYIEANTPSSGSLYKQPQRTAMEPKPPGVSRISASLPRSYQPLDSARLTSVVTPRPFGSQSSRITSLPRAFATDNSNKRVNGNVDVSKKSSVPSRYHQFMTSEDEAQSSSAHSSEDEEEQEEATDKNVISTQSIAPVPLQTKNENPVIPSPATETIQESCCETRISLNQKPNSSRDFGFQATWDSTGAHVTSIQAGSPAEMFQLQHGDEVLTVNGHKVAEMSYTDWKASMEEALMTGSLVMDIRRHGKNNWDRDQPSLPFKSHKTINLTSMDHPILIGFPDSNTSLDLTSHVSMETLPSTKAPTHSVIDVASNGVNGGFREEPVTMRNKESEPISLKNLKRRSEFFEQGGSESVMPDIPVPSITPSASRWSWDPEEERRRQEKWQKEQERLLQEKYKRDQEKLQEEWLKAQQEIAKGTVQQEPGSLEVSTPSPLSPLSPISQPTPPSWEEEEQKRREEEQERQRQAEEERRRRWEEEEQERQRQAEEKRKWEEEQERRRQAEERRKWEEEQERRRREEAERRKREEEEREFQRLQEERKRREREEQERKKREEDELRWQRRREEEEERRRQEAAEQQRRERERAWEQQQWPRGSSFATQEPELSFADRAKSKSSPQLDEDEKPQRKVTGVGGLADKKGQQPMTQAELERQQILNEMKKKNQLLTDSSWIRQRSANTATGKETDTPPMRRGESLDNLDASSNSWRSSWTPRSNNHIPDYPRPHSALSGSTSFYGGGSGARSGSSTLPSSYSTGSLRGRAGTPSSSWSQQSPSLSPSSLSPTTSPEPTSEVGGLQQRSRSVSGKKICTFCDTPLGKGAAMIIESLGLCYHLSCFKCIDCKSSLGGSEAGAEVRIRNKQLYCNSCYMRFKTGQPTAM
ncbi:LIM domain only protein 7 isoform 2-T2 [Aulostomus maculatus]